MKTKFLSFHFIYLFALFIYFFLATQQKLPINIRFLNVLFSTQKERIEYVKSSQNLTHCMSYFSVLCYPPLEEVE